MKLGSAHQGGRDRAHGDSEFPDVPGYRPLGRLGVDSRAGVEVWKAEGPGGFRAAIRVIRLGADARPDDLRGLDLFRRARHPNLLAAFGSWRVPGALVLATELPDGTLWDRFLEARAGGQPGVPRDELIDHLAEAARGIDYLNGVGGAHGPSPADTPGPGPGAPHGGITPRTILFVGGGIKVADADVGFAGESHAPSRPSGGEDPLWRLDYTAPEQSRSQGRASRQSDQYSLAVCYCHLRVGRLPFSGARADADEGPPRCEIDLSSLPAAERPALGRALAADPDLRWPSCRSFLDALRDAAHAADAASGLGDPAAARPRPHVSRASALGFAAAGVATVAGTLVLASRSLVLDRIGFTTTSASPPAASNAAYTPPSGPRFRLQDSGDDLPIASLASSSPSVSTGTSGPDLEPATVTPGPAPAPTPTSFTAPAPAPDKAAETPAARESPASASASAPPSLAVSAGTGALVAWLKDGEPVNGATRVGPVARAAGGTRPTRDRSPAIRVQAPEALSVQVGRAASLRVMISSEGVAGPVEVRLTGLPRGVTASVLTEAAGEAESSGESAPRGGSSRLVRVQAGPNSPEGETVARLVATAGPARSETAVRVSVQPTPALAARRRGDVLLRREEYAAAVVKYTEAIALDSADPMAFHGRALASYGKGDLDAALADVETSLRLKPETPTALNNRGLIKLAKGDTAAAIADFDAAVGLDPAYAVVRYNRGRAYSESGAAEKALADFNEAVRLDPRFAKAYKARADVLAHLGDRTRALADYDEAIRIRADDPAALNNRGLLLFARGEHHRAIADFDEAIRLNPRYAVVRYNRGRVYAYLGDAVEALSSFDQAILLDPSLARAHQARVELLNRSAESSASSPRPGLGVATRGEAPRRNSPASPPQ